MRSTLPAPWRRPLPVLVDELPRRGGFRALAPAWRALADRLGLDGPFHRPEWFAVVAAHLARPPARLRLLAAHRGGELCGVLPLLDEPRTMGGAPVRLLRALSDDHSQRFEPLAADDEAVEALWRHLASARPLPHQRPWDVLELRDVPVGSPTADRLIELGRRDGFFAGDWEAQRSPVMTLPPTAEQLDQRLDAKFRSNLRRRRRGLEAALGPVRLEHVTATDGPAIDRALADGFALEASGWKGAAGTAIARDPALFARYRALGRLFARRGELSLHFLVAGERRVAFHFAIETGGVYYLFKPGYDESLARFGPGHLLVHEVARALCARGARALDLLGEDMEWKRCWTSEVRAHRFRYLFRPSALGRGLWAWKCQLVPALKEVAARAGDRAPAAEPETP